MIRAALCALVATPAAAEPICIARPDLAAYLQEQYGEHLTARLLSSDESSLVEIFTAKGTWTMVITDTADRSCIVGAGGAWIVEGVPQGEPG